MQKPMKTPRGAARKARRAKIDWVQVRQDRAGNSPKPWQSYLPQEPGDA